MRKIICVCLVVIATLPAAAQKTKQDRKDERKQRINALIKQEEEGVIAYRKQSVFGFKLVNDGYGGFYEFGRAQSVKKSLLFQFDFAERKHSKEQKQTNPFLPTSPFVYGKINFFYPLKLGVQQQFLLGNKTNKNGVAVTANFGGGITLGLLRPYYLEINDTANGSRKAIKYDSADSTTFASSDMLRSLSVASGGFTKGWGEIKITPGAYAKAALRFDYGRYNEIVSAIEAGVTAEYYTKKIPQLIYVTPKAFFVNAYVALVFGKRK
jgi:hypothetical protein